MELIVVAKSKADFEARVRAFQERRSRGSVLIAGGARLDVPAETLLSRSGEIPDDDGSGWVEGSAELRIAEPEVAAAVLGCWWARLLSERGQWSADENQFVAVVVSQFAQGLLAGSVEPVYEWLYGVACSSVMGARLFLVGSGREFAPEVAGEVARAFLGLEDVRGYVGRCGWDLVRVA